MLDILLLSPLVASAQDKDYNLSEPRKVHPIAGTPINAQLHDAAAYACAIAEVARRETRKPRLDAREGMQIAQTAQPFLERPSALRRLVKAELHAYCNL
jgi:hypothetical protein